ncbi:hypothetical protein GCM10027440_16240 [Nocardiopsis coralliicola]
MHTVLRTGTRQDARVPRTALLAADAVPVPGTRARAAAARARAGAGTARRPVSSAYAARG